MSHDSLSTEDDDDPCRVLVIDDEPALRDSMRIFLRTAYEVSTAASVDEAMAVLREQPAPKVIILDMNMPEKDGLQGLREIKPAFPGIPVLILSGYVDDETLKNAQELGAAGFMRKPFDLAELLNTIKDFASRSQPQQSQTTTARQAKVASAISS